MGIISISIISIIITVLHSASSQAQLSQDQQKTMNTLHELLGKNPKLSWNISKDPCLWAGVICSNNSSVITQLSLSNIALSNSAVLSLACQINTLEGLDVSRNQLSSIPGEFLNNCGEIPGLRLVNLSLNSISGTMPPFSSAGFDKLEYLDLSHNLLSGNIGMQLNGLANLRSLNLSFNSFSGVIPVNLGKSMSLEQLQLSVNQFVGVIPDALADFKNLTILDLSRNNISGKIPPRIGELQKLQILVLSGNLLTGEVPGFISNISTLERFAANQNNFTGEIPAGISRFLKNLDLSFNNLTGFIPVVLLSQPKLQTVDLSSNFLVGSIPRNLSAGLVRLRLGNNSLSGTIMPINFGQLKNLEYLELENNFLSGRIPSELGSCQKLTLLSLGRNAFSGVLPAELGNLNQLQVLNLQQNRLSGEIPPIIANLSGLLTLDLSWNSLRGSIPYSISGLKYLAYLHLQGNNFSGSIPRNIGDLSYLIELQLGSNRLTGSIPPMPKNLQYALNLSYNLFTGPIPGSLSQLSSLEILDLSHNGFSGEIPQSLTGMMSLTQLLLDNNDLTGVVPTFSQHVKVDTSGNVGLRSSQETTPGSRKRSSSRVKIAVAIAAPVGALVALIAVFLSRNLLYNRASQVEYHPEEDNTPQSQSIEARFLTTNSTHKSNIDFDKAMEEVSNPLNLVLKTKFSSYYKVMMPSGQSYFVKRLNRGDILIQLGCLENFRQELEGLAKINGSNIMTPLAYMWAPDGAYLFYRTSVKTTLFSVLHRSAGIPLEWASRCSIAIGVAQGLAYLHTCSSGPILLFDLSSTNILLKSLTEPQIGDIELCKLIDPSKNTTSLSAVAGSVGYIPPEYAYTMRVTTEGNVYSFGVILLELLTGKEAVTQGTELAKWASDNSTQPQKWEQMLDFSISRTSQTVKTQMLAVLKIAFACIDASSLARPKMKSVLRMLLNAI